MNRVLRNDGTWHRRNGPKGIGIAKLSFWTPSAITTAMWLDAADATTITIDTGVSEWRDKSGNARHATQATGANQPSVISAELNSKNIVRFDGSNDRLGFDSPLFVGTNYTINIVTARRSNKVENFFLGNDQGTSANLHVGWQSNTNIRFAHFGNSTLVDTGVAGYTSPIYGVWGFRFSTSDGIAIYNSGTLANINSGGTTALGSYNNAGIGGPYYSSYFNGDIAELVVTTTALSTTDRQKMEGYLAWKWGLVSDLPNDHPYKNAEPTI